MTVECYRPSPPAAACSVWSYQSHQLHCNRVDYSTKSTSVDCSTEFSIKAGLVDCNAEFSIKAGRIDCGRDVLAKLAAFRYVSGDSVGAKQGR